MANTEIPCWIRNQLPGAALDKPAKKATQDCQYRQQEIKPGNVIVFACAHPIATGEYQVTENLPNGETVGGGVAGYATFCEPVDMHLTALEKPSRLIRIIDATATDPTRKLLPPPQE